MASQPVKLPDHISPCEWGRTPASIQRLVEGLLSTTPGSVQSILALQAQIQREKALNRVVQAIIDGVDGVDGVGTDQKEFSILKQYVKRA